MRINIAKLIAQLKSYPADMRVVVSGYEGGYNDISFMETREISLNVHKEYYMGAHDDAVSGKEKMAVLWLGGENENKSDD